MSLKCVFESLHDTIGQHTHSLLPSLFHVGGYGGYGGGAGGFFPGGGQKAAKRGTAESVWIEM